ncbi:hypothetical protein [Paenibacillus eucommiae]|uniref:Uncharacterized protein n=1 Tax=Paenibacillus eucommiae TaxID=1355755 RepID=A0ABS4IMT8_9BACL|nr:hypothetical protein [Paenibacillus eucommiae]MBP1988882.1 hypothetical protein [Paenibacillus eucommiae]
MIGQMDRMVIAERTLISPSQDPVINRILEKQLARAVLLLLRQDCNPVYQAIILF